MVLSIDPPNGAPTQASNISHNVVPGVAVHFNPILIPIRLTKSHKLLPIHQWKLFSQFLVGELIVIIV